MEDIIAEYEKIWIHSIIAPALNFPMQTRPMREGRCCYGVAEVYSCQPLEGVVATWDTPRTSPT